MIIVDTNVLMHTENVDDLYEDFEHIHIPIEVLMELDNLKTQPRERGYLARRAIRGIKNNMDNTEFLIHDEKPDIKAMIMDDRIIEHCVRDETTILLTNDINMEIKADAKGIKCENYHGKKREPITPVKKILMTSREYEDFKTFKGHTKTDDVLVGQFASLYNERSMEQMGTYRFLGEGMWDKVNRKDKIKNYLCDVEPRDVNQACALKTLRDDEFSIITGPAGTGKTLISLSYCLEQISQGAVVHIFVNPVKTRNTQDLGYYPGSRNEKLLSNFIGGILSSKLGDEIEIYRLISDGSLKIYPFSDIRGIEILSGDIMYITEAQNLTIDLMKLAIQRCADGSQLIVEGDYEAQVDHYCFEGHNSGLKRAIEVFTGTNSCDFGYVNLPNIYRSDMANKAEEM